MVQCYTGTPGSGKSLHCAREILFRLKQGKRVICNFPINTSMIKKKHLKNFFYVPDDVLTPAYLFEFARGFHKEMKEDQTFVYLDEAQRIFPIDRIYDRRKEWEQFFQLHRHYGFSIVLVTQNMSYINKGIRIQTEYEIRHRKVNNYGLFGLFLTLLHIPLFCSLTFWQGTREKIYSDFFLFKRKYGKLYNTFGNFNTDYSVADQHVDRQQEDKNNEDETIHKIDNLSQEEKLNMLFGDPDEQEEIDFDSTDFDEENFESWDSDCKFSIDELRDWRTA